MLAFTLDKNIDGRKLLHQIQNLISKFQLENQGTQALLVIDIKTISQDNNNFIPKLEYKQS